MHKTLPWKSADNYCFYLDIFIQHCHFYPRSVISGWVSAILSLRVSRCFKNCRLCRQGRGEVSPGGPVQLIRQGGRGKAGVGWGPPIISSTTALQPSCSTHTNEIIAYTEWYSMTWQDQLSLPPPGTSFEYYKYYNQQIDYKPLYGLFSPSPIRRNTREEGRGGDCFN